MAPNDPKKVGQQLAKQMLTQRGFKVEAALAMAIKFGSNDVLSAIEEVRSEGGLTGTQAKQLEKIESSIKRRIAPGQAVGNASTAQEALPVFQQGQRTIFNNAYVEIGGRRASFDGGQVYEKTMHLRRDNNLQDLYHQRAKLYGEMKNIDPDTGRETLEEMEKRVRSIDRQIKITVRSGMRDAFGTSYPTQDEAYRTLRQSSRERTRGKLDTLGFNQKIDEQIDIYKNRFDAFGGGPEGVKAVLDELGKTEDDMTHAYRAFDLYRSVNDTPDRKTIDKLWNMFEQHPGSMTVDLPLAAAIEEYRSDISDYEYFRLGHIRGQETADGGWMSYGIDEQGPGVEHEFDDGFEALFESDEVKKIRQDMDRARTRVGMRIKYTDSASVEEMTAHPVTSFVQMRAAARGNYAMSQWVDKEIRAYEKVNGVDIMNEVNRTARNMVRLPRDAWKASYLDLISGLSDFDGTVKIAKDITGGTPAYLRGANVKYYGSANVGGGYAGKVGMSFVSGDTIRIGSAKDIVQEYLNMSEIATQTRDIERQAILTELSHAKRMYDLKSKKVFGNGNYLVTMDNGGSKLTSVAFTSREAATEWLRANGPFGAGFKFATDSDGNTVKTPVRMESMSLEDMASDSRVTVRNISYQQARDILDEGKHAGSGSVLSKSKAEAVKTLFYQKGLDDVTPAHRITSVIKDAQIRDTLNDFLDSPLFLHAGENIDSLQSALVKYLRGVDTSERGQVADALFKGIRMLSGKNRGPSAEGAIKMLNAVVTGRMGQIVDRRSSFKYSGKYAQAMIDAASYISKTADEWMPFIDKEADTVGEMRAVMIKDVKNILKGHGFKDTDDIWQMFERGFSTRGSDDSINSIIAGSKSFLSEMGNSLSSYRDTRGSESLSKAAFMIYGRHWDELVTSEKDHVENWVKAADDAHKVLLESLLVDENSDAMDIIRRSSLSDMFAAMRDVVHGEGYQDSASYRALRKALGIHGISANADIQDIARVATGGVSKMSEVRTALNEMITTGFGDDIQEGPLADIVHQYISGDKYSGDSIEEIVDNAIKDRFTEARVKKMAPGHAATLRKRVEEAREGFVDMLYAKTFDIQNTASSGSDIEFMLGHMDRQALLNQADNAVDVAKNIITDEGEESFERGAEGLTESRIRKQARQYHIHQENIASLRSAARYNKHQFKTGEITQEVFERRKGGLALMASNNKAGMDAILENISRHSGIENFFAEVDELRVSKDSIIEMEQELGDYLEGSFKRVGSFDSGDVDTTLGGFIRSLSANGEEILTKDFQAILNETLIPAFKNGDPDVARQAVSAVFGDATGNVEVHIARAAVRKANGQATADSVMKNVLILKDKRNEEAPVMAWELTQARDGSQKWKWSLSKLEGDEIIEAVSFRDITAAEDSLSKGSIEMLNEALKRTGRDAKDIKERMQAILPGLIDDREDPNIVLRAMRDYGNLEIPDEILPDAAVEARNAGMFGNANRGLLDHMVLSYGEIEDGKLPEYDAAVGRMIDQDRLAINIARLSASTASASETLEDFEIRTTKELEEAFSKLADSTPERFTKEMGAFFKQGHIKRNVIVGGTILGLAAAKRIHDKGLTDRTNMFLQMDHPGSEAITRVASNEDGYNSTVRSRTAPHGAPSPSGPSSMSSLSSTIAVRDNLKHMTSADLDDLIS